MQQVSFPDINSTVPTIQAVGSTPPRARNTPIPVFPTSPEAMDPRLATCMRRRAGSGGASPPTGGG